MKQIRTARELYCELLKSFYFGKYQMGDQLMTYQETHEIYGLAKDTIGMAYSMLRRDGFIFTDGAKGTIVTFDVNNPEHVAKVPIEWPSAEPEDNIPYEVAMWLHAQSLYSGLTHSGEEQLKKCKELVEEILQCLKSGRAYYNQIFSFWMCVISALENDFLTRIADHFINRYLYLLPPARLSSSQLRLIGDSAQEYYAFLLDALERHDFKEFPERFEKHYRNYYQCGGVVFSKLEDGAIFKEQALYGRLLDDLCIKIMAGELKKGCTLPTTKGLCAEYGLSTTTVNRAYGILAEMGLISRHVRSGTKLIADPDDPEIWETLETVSGLYKSEWLDAIEALNIIIRTLSRRIVITPDVVRQMWAEYARQYKIFENYTTPFFVSGALLSPLIASLPAGILHKYYVHLTDSLSKIITLCTFRVHVNEEHGKEISRLMLEALDMLEQGDQESFAALSERAMLRNAKLLTEDYTYVVKGNTNYGNK